MEGKETCFEIIAKQMGFTGGFIGESFVIASYSDTGTRERSGTAQPERYQWTGTGTQRNSPAIGGEKGLRKGWLDRTGRVFRSDKEKKYMKKIIETIFIISSCMLFFLFGMLTGKDIQVKAQEQKEEQLDVIPLSQEEMQKNILMDNDNIKVYLLKLSDQGVELAVENNTKEKINDICLDNAWYNEKKVSCYAYIGGVNAGETKRCTLFFAESPGGKDGSIDFSGTLSLRGKVPCYVKQVEMHN